MLILTRREVENALDMGALIPAIAEAMGELADGVSSVAPRVGVTADAVGGWLGGMLASVPRESVLASKLVSVFPNPAASGIPTHQAVIVVFDDRTGTPRALMDGSYITEVRTAATSAVATQFLARLEARTLGIIGTGVQARAHALAMCQVREIRRILVSGRRPEATQQLATRLASELGLPTEAVSSYRETVERADILCVATHSPEPVVLGEWLRPGVHINSVGVNREGRELDADAVARCVVVVDTRAAALAPPGAAGSNELLWAIRDGVITEDHVKAELGELVVGSRVGRTAEDQMTLYKSVGVAVQDAVAAALVLSVAEERGLGVNIPLEGPAAAALPLPSGEDSQAR